MTARFRSTRYPDGFGGPWTVGPAPSPRPGDRPSTTPRGRAGAGLPRDGRVRARRIARPPARPAATAWRSRAGPAPRRRPASATASSLPAQQQEGDRPGRPELAPFLRLSTREQHVQVAQGEAGLTEPQVEVGAALPRVQVFRVALEQGVVREDRPLLPARFGVDIRQVEHGGAGNSVSGGVGDDLPVGVGGPVKSPSDPCTTPSSRATQERSGGPP